MASQAHTSNYGLQEHDHVHLDLDPLVYVTWSAARLPVRCIHIRRMDGSAGSAVDSEQACCAANGWRRS
ncbi:uncharacterized protein FOMMEDRAFT_16895 [Fomitiporia mediterranea MF3/22]|uniref:uncharacterized protein n=1 Tax=Fomitiporia mediterranea (strain MF3/22) TaxID=694068 RepID=UPI0004407989|nr:uncharacterized protein FOMMEDRAFT_16895 [Fomitiporia mediterranea MF3/22]EJD08582.1 hypothetical protein FOMMEDRAFT_16895 [Fomitiporia mediterranea MF3/22]